LREHSGPPPVLPYGPRRILDDVTDTYRSLLRRPSAVRLAFFGLPAQLPMATYGIGLLSLVRHTTGSWGTAGVVAAAYTASVVVSQVTLGRLVQRWWFPAVLVTTTLLHGAAMLALLVSGAGQVPLTAGLAAIAGTLQPPAAVVVRSRWAGLVADERQLDLAMFLQSALDEAVFLAGPALISGLGTLAGPEPALGAAAGLTVVGNLGLASRSVHRHDQPPGRRSRGLDPAVTRLSLGFLALGAAFAAVQVGVFARSGAAGGFILTAFSLVSLAAGAVVGRRHPSGSLRAGLAVLGAALVLPTAPLPAVPFVVVLLPAATAASPSVALGFGQAARAATAERRAAAFAWCSASLGAGLAVGDIVAGLVAEQAGARTVFVFGALSALLGALVARPDRLDVVPAAPPDLTHAGGDAAAGAASRDRDVASALVAGRRLRVRGGGVGGGRGRRREDPAARPTALPGG
jgi:predicted MFS family arabinose efflux permease